MKKYYDKTFARQLILYLLTVLFITFSLITITLFSSLTQFVDNNAYTQAEAIKNNVLLTLDHEFARIELLPNSIFQLYDYIDESMAAALPVKILNGYPMLAGCSVHFDTLNPHAAPHVCAYRREDGSIVRETPSECKNCPPAQRIIRQNAKNGYWIDSKIDGRDVMSYCEPILNKRRQTLGILRLDISIRELTHFIGHHKLSQSGYLFITDQCGNFIPNSNTANYKDIFSQSAAPESAAFISQLMNKGKGCGKITKNGVRYYLYFTKIPEMSWHLGIICPYNEIVMSSNKLYILLFICFSFGIIFLFGSIIKIVKKLSSPLNELSGTARKMAEGQFDVKLTPPNSTLEIRELYESFSYMQANIINYIERLKLNTIEKEQLNMEMKLARKIQQRFLPTGILLPSKIKLFGELRQSKAVGGDLYDYFIIENRLYFAIGDVSGNGTPAALYMSSIIKLFRYVASSHNSTAEICHIINSRMCDDNNDDMYITMFMGIMDINTGAITFTNAGHPYPLVLHDSGEISILDKYPDVPIGILEDHIYSEHIYALAPGSQLVIYTDGITDTENTEGQFYGKEKMMECIRSIPVKSPENIVNAILNDINRHMLNTHQSDDLTILAIQYE